MGRSALILLIVAVAALYLCEVVVCEEACGPNQAFNACGTACPTTCAQPKTRKCTKQCVAGCQCVRGYHTQADGSCIEASQCPGKQYVATMV